MVTNIAKIAAALLVIVLLFVALFSTNKVRLLKNEGARKDLAIIALNSKITKTVKDNTATYSKPSPELTVKEITESAIFQSMTDDQRKYYEGLIKVQKGLLATAQAKLSKRDVIVVTKYVSEAAGSNDSTVCFTRGEKVHLSDTTKMLKWKTELVLNTPIKTTTTYTYNPTVSATFKRDAKTKETVVEFKLDDPDLAVTDIKSLVIPSETVNRTRVGQWIYDRRKVFRFIGAAGLFTGGVFLGAKM